jgi:hypothetical protein
MLKNRARIHQFKDVFVENLKNVGRTVPVHHFAFNVECLLALFVVDGFANLDVIIPTRATSQD